MLILERTQLFSQRCLVDVEMRQHNCDAKRQLYSDVTENSKLRLRFIAYDDVVVSSIDHIIDQWSECWLPLKNILHGWF